MKETVVVKKAGQTATTGANTATMASSRNQGQVKTHGKSSFITCMVAFIVACCAVLAACSLAVVILTQLTSESAISKVREQMSLLENTTHSQLVRMSTEISKIQAIPGKAELRASI